MTKSAGGYGIPITIAVAVATVIGGSIVGWGRVRSEIHTRVESELNAKTAELRSDPYDDSRVLARVSEVERNYATVAKGIADLRGELERLPAPEIDRYDDSEVRERLDKLEEVSVEFARGLSMLAQELPDAPPLSDASRPCMDLQPGEECTLSLEPRVAVGVFDGGMQITWPDWAAWQTLTIGDSDGRRQETVSLDAGEKTLKYAESVYVLWIAEPVDQDAARRELTIGIRRDK